MSANRLTCEVCGKSEAVGVFAVPGVPYSAAYCRECIQADAHPITILAANVACCGGLTNCADWVKEIVNNTLKHLNKTEDDFNNIVDQMIKNMDDYEGIEEI